MIRYDGQYIVYCIQYKRTSPIYLERGEEWGYANLDYFGYGHHLFRPCKTLNGRNKGFSASGECWQATGIYGTFYKDAARRLKNWLVYKYPNKKFRIVQINISQETVEVE